MAEYDAVIRNGMVIDGTRMPRYRADVAIKDGRIAATGRFPTDAAARNIDATGTHLAPVLVDLHHPYHSLLLLDPATSYSTGHAAPSVTTRTCV